MALEFSPKVCVWRVMKAYSPPLNQSDIHWEATLYAAQWALSIKYVFHPLQLYKDKCTWKLKTASGWTRRFPYASEESWILPNYLISQQVESQFFHSKTNPLSAHISCILSLKDIIRLHPAQFMTNHPDAWQILPSEEALRGLWSVFYQDRPILALSLIHESTLLSSDIHCVRFAC